MHCTADLTPPPSGLLPPSGENVTLARLICAAHHGFSLGSDISTALGSAALISSTTGDANTFRLRDLGQHENEIEHDGSMTRLDEFEGDANGFSAVAYGRTVERWGGEEILTVGFSGALLFLLRVASSFSWRGEGDMW